MARSERREVFIQLGRSCPVGSEADIRYGGIRRILAEESGGVTVHAKGMSAAGNAGYELREEVRLLFSVLDVRERLVARLALLAGMRPGEIFGLKWQRMEADYADIRQRV